MPDKDALRAAVFKAVEDYCAADFGYSFDPKNPIVRLHEPTFNAGEINAALECLLSTYVTMGPKVKKFEEVFTSTFGWTDGVMNNSGSSANLLAVAALANPATRDGLRPGDEVIVPALSWSTTVWPIIQCGLVPVIVDIDPATFNIDPNHVEDLVTDRTRAILPVHLYGRPADMTSLMAIAERRGLWVIEDAAQAHGAEIDGRRCGSIGHLACFSFYPGKNLGAYGDAGAVTGNDASVLDRIRRLRDHGRTSKYEHLEVGFAERIDALQAAILAAKLPHLEDWTESRRRIAAKYSGLLGGSDVVTPDDSAAVRHVYHLYVIRSSARDGLLEHLKRAGVAAGIHYPIPLHRQPAYMNRGYGSVSLPHSERAAAEVLSLPIYPELSDTQQQAVVDAVGSFRG